VTIDVFGGTATIEVVGAAPDGTTPQVAALHGAAVLRRIHAALTRFDPASELSRLNADPRTTVPASWLLRRMARAVGQAGRSSGGLVDGTQLAAIEEAGYAASRGARPAAVSFAPLLKAAAVHPRPALPDPAARWAAIAADDAAATITRPVGVRLDGGGLVKGLACDLVAARLTHHPRFAIECSGDLRVGGTIRSERPVLVAAPLGGGPVAQLAVDEGAVGTSGVTRRWWRGPDGAPAHHVIDPGRGTPAHTGLLQVTALAPTALDAEVRAKAALLAGPEAASAHLPDGGVLVGLDHVARHVHPAVRDRVAA
jgi:thiamine biosynthesis lipoprotein